MSFSHPTRSRNFVSAFWFTWIIGTLLMELVYFDLGANIGDVIILTPIITLPAALLIVLVKRLSRR